MGRKIFTAILSLCLLLISVQSGDVTDLPVSTEDKWLDEDDSAVPITSEEEYKSIANDLDPNLLRIIYVYHVKTGAALEERNRRFVGEVETHLATAIDQLDNIAISSKFYKIDCGVTVIAERCDINEPDHYHQMFTIRNGRTEAVSFFVASSALEDNYILKRLLQSISLEWRNFNGDLHSGKYFEQTRQKYPQKDMVLCYGQENNNYGRTFCYMVGNYLSTRDDVNVVAVSDKKLLTELELYNELKLDAANVKPVLALWYFNCSGAPTAKWTKDCAIYSYLFDNEMANIQNFFDCLLLPPVVSMKKGGSIPIVYEMCHVGYYIYSSTADKGREMADWRLRHAEETAYSVRGSLVVVMMDVDTVNLDSIRPYFTESERQHLPLFKIHFTDPLTMSREMEVFKAEGDAVTFFKKLASDKYDFSHLYDSPTAVDSGVSFVEDGDDPRNQDDEVEIVLHNLRNESCFFCPPKYGKIQELTATTLDKALEDNFKFTVLFWLNVDTMSRAVFHVLLSVGPDLDEASGVSGRVGALACHDWPEACEKYRVIRYPQVLTFKEQQKYKEYQGTYETKLLSNYIHLIHAGALVGIGQQEQLTQFLTGSGLEGKVTVPAVTLAVLPSWENAELTNAYTDVCFQLHGHYVLGAIAGELASKWAAKHFPGEELPIVVTVKTQETHKGMVKWSRQNAESNRKELAVDIAHFIQKASTPNIIELTDLTFPLMFRERKPLVLLLGKDAIKHGDMKFLRTISQDEWIQKNSILTHLEKDRYSSVTHALLNTSQLTDMVLPALIVIDSANGELYTLPEIISKKESDVTTWVTKALKKEIPASVKLPARKWKGPEVKRRLMYDYKGYIYGVDSTPVTETKSETKEEMGETTSAPPMESKSKKAEAVLNEDAQENDSPVPPQTTPTVEL